MIGSCVLIALGTGIAGAATTEAIRQAGQGFVAGGISDLIKSCVSGCLTLRDEAANHHLERALRAAVSRAARCLAVTSHASAGAPLAFMEELADKPGRILSEDLTKALLGGIPEDVESTLRQSLTVVRGFEDFANSLAAPLAPLLQKAAAEELKKAGNSRAFKAWQLQWQELIYAQIRASDQAPQLVPMSPEDWAREAASVLDSQIEAWIQKVVKALREEAQAALKESLASFRSELAQVLVEHKKATESHQKESLELQVAFLHQASLHDVRALQSLTRAGAREALEDRDWTAISREFRTLGRGPVEGDSGFYFANQETPFLGRTKEREQLAEFLAGDGFRWMILSGRPGSGKSRLALEVMLDQRASGWRAAFLNAGALEKVAGMTFDQPSLLILDYTLAGARQEAAKVLIDDLARKVTPQPLRVIVITRPTRSGLYDIGPRTQTREASEARWREEVVLDRMEEADLLQILLSTAPRLSPAEALKSLSQLTRHDPSLRPLFVQYAGQALQEGRTITEWSTKGLLSLVWDDVGKWLPKAKKRLEWLLLLLGATLAGGLSLADEQGLPPGVRRVGEEEEEELLERLASLTSGYDPLARLLPPVEPDILGEFLAHLLLAGWKGSENSLPASEAREGREAMAVVRWAWEHHQAAMAAFRERFEGAFPGEAATLARLARPSDLPIEGLWEASSAVDAAVARQDWPAVCDIVVQHAPLARESGAGEVLWEVRALMRSISNAVIACPDETSISSLLKESKLIAKSHQSDALCQAWAANALSASAAVAFSGDWHPSDAGRASEAEDLYRAVVSLDPSNAVAHHNLAGLLGDMAERGWDTKGRGPEELYRLAEELFERALELDPSYALAHHNLAWLLQKMAERGWDTQGRGPEELYRLAEELFERALELDPSYALSHHNLAWLLQKMAERGWDTKGRGPEELYRLAEAGFERALELDPSNAAAHHNLARFLQDMVERGWDTERRGPEELYRLAEAGCERALSLMPDDAVIIYYGAALRLSAILRGWVGGEEAERSLQEAEEWAKPLGSNWTHPAYPYLHSRLCLLRGETEVARDWAEQAVKLAELPADRRWTVRVHLHGWALSCSSADPSLIRRLVREERVRNIRWSDPLLDQALLGHPDEPEIRALLQAHTSPPSL